MKIFLLLSVLILVILFIAKMVFNTAKRNLLPDQAAWSGKDMKIKYRKSNKISESKRVKNYLKIIADESKIYLEDQSKKELQ